MQEGHVISYESKKLYKHAKYYVTHDLEPATIMHALKKWRDYLLGRKFILIIDHNGLRYVGSGILQGQFWG